MEWLLIAAAIVVGVPAAAWLAQDHLIFFPQSVGSTAHLPQHAISLTLTTADGTRLDGWMVPAQSTPAPTVIYFGGNAEEVSWTLADGRWPRAYNIAAFNYRGYGTSQGKPAAAALLADGLAIYDTIASRPDVDPTRIVVFGRSLGTAVATHIASERDVDRAVLVSPYDSLAAIGGHHYPWLPVSLLLRHRFVPVEDAARAQAPMLSIVAAGDSIIPPAHSRALFDAWAGPKEWVELPRLDHNTLGATREFWDAIARFLESR